MGLGKSFANSKRGPGGLDPKELLLAAVYAGDTGQQNTPNLGVDVDDVDDLTKKSLKIQ